VSRRRRAASAMNALQPYDFFAKWSGSTRPERAASQEHFTDLCRMLGVPTPNEADPTGDWYAFEKGAEKSAGGDGFADVWKRGHFAWEYKGKRKDLTAAYQQLLQYREALENPPLLVVCDLDRFEVHTNFTGTVKRVYHFSLEDLHRDPREPMRILRAAFSSPEALRPSTTRVELTEKAVRRFAQLAQRLREPGHDAHSVAHFLNKLVFCLFAEDAGLLPSGLMWKLASATRLDPKAFVTSLAGLFQKMSVSGGMFGAERIQWFNGGLFDGPEVIPLSTAEIDLIREVAVLDWSQIEPAIFGTLFERGLAESKRAQLGAHYTDRESILRLIEPVLMAPLRREFEAVKIKIRELAASGKKVTVRTPAERNPEKVLQTFLDRVESLVVLDPACGSGNFLYVALQCLKNFEREVIEWGELEARIPRAFPRVGPHQLRGLEVNDYAAEIARVTIWIGEIQWMLANGFAYRTDPILHPLDNITCCDALIDHSSMGAPIEREWPRADVIVGNPPFLGGKLLRKSLGDVYVNALFAVYQNRVPAEADFVAYWFEKARDMIERGQSRRVGLLATQGIRGGANREVLERIKGTGDIFLAWSDQPWVLEGAAVHVSFVGFDDGSQTERVLDGRTVASIHSDLSSGVDLTQARRLKENLGVAFMGDTKGGAFVVEASQAKEWLRLENPHGRGNSEVLARWINGLDVTRRSRDKWIVDFGVDIPVDAAALFEAPFEHVKQHVFPKRSQNKREAYARRWWLHVEPRPKMRRALRGLKRYLVTPTVAKHRIFAWIDGAVLPDHQLIAFARDDDYTFGVLHSRVHRVWTLRTGTQVRDAKSGFRYTPTSTFETFPFPHPTPKQKQDIAELARELHERRNTTLNPPGASAAELAKCTLTRLYNRMPTWLEQLHARLDAAVVEAYGWAPDSSDDALLVALLALNLEREPVADDAVHEDEPEYGEDDESADESE
jgi:hypothetical protein